MVIGVIVLFCFSIMVINDELNINNNANESEKKNQMKKTQPTFTDSDVKLASVLGAWKKSIAIPKVSYPANGMEPRDLIVSLSGLVGSALWFH